MKKVIGFILSLVLLCALTVPAMAAAGEAVVYTADSSFTAGGTVTVDKEKTLANIYNSGTSDEYNAFLEGRVQYYWMRNDSYCTDGMSITLAEKDKACQFYCVVALYSDADHTQQIGTVTGAKFTVPNTEAAVIPEIKTEALPNGTVGEAYYLKLDCTDPDAVFSLASSSLPDGLYLTQHGEIEGTPTKAGCWQVVIRVTPEAGEAYAGLKEFEMTVTEPAAAVIPEIKTEAIPNGTVGEAYYLKLDCTDPDVVFSLFRSSLPDGLYLTQHGEIEGTPTKAGFWYVVIMVTPEAGEDYANTKEFEMTITEPAASSPDTPTTPTDPDVSDKPDGSTDSVDPADKTDGQDGQGLPVWSIPVIAVGAAGGGVGITLAVLKKKKV